MTTALQLHARDRKILECEAYDKVSNLTIIKKGIFGGISGGRVLVSIPTANNVMHRFKLLADKDGFGYEGSMNAPRGWRIKLDQLKDVLPTVPQHQEPDSADSSGALDKFTDQEHTVQPVP